MKIYFPEITFSAAHYIPGHPQCGGLHGHTYFVRNLEIEIETLDSVGMSIDFGLIKRYFKSEWDHKFFVPGDDYEKWREAFLGPDAPINMDVEGHWLRAIKHTTAEWMVVEIRKGLGELMEWNEVVSALKIHFDLYEGPNQAVKV